MKRSFRDSKLFKKKISKLKGQELINVLKKVDEILAIEDLNHYKNLSYELSSYKRTHVNDSYVILFFGNDGVVYFVDYEHHDTVYKHNKKFLKKYTNLRSD